VHAAAAPRTAISCGGRRGFPGPRVMETFGATRTRAAVTKHQGAVTWVFGRDGPRETTQLSPPPPAPPNF
jgi:beta-lactamase superfamily II metal-dependent hydrolase